MKNINANETNNNVQNEAFPRYESILDYLTEEQKNMQIPLEMTPEMIAAKYFGLNNEKKQ